MDGCMIAGQAQHSVSGNWQSDSSMDRSAFPLTAAFSTVATCHVFITRYSSANDTLFSWNMSHNKGSSQWGGVVLLSQGVGNVDEGRSLSINHGTGWNHDSIIWEIELSYSLLLQLNLISNRASQEWCFSYGCHSRFLLNLTHGSPHNLNSQLHMQSITLLHYSNNVSVHVLDF